MLVLDLLSGADLSLAGVLWALAAMVGAATYFVVSADEDNGLPPMALAAGGLVVGGARAGRSLGLVGLLPMDASTASVEYAGRTVAWWVPLVLLGVVTAALPYTTGIAGIRRLGSRLASFVALLEVVAGVVFAWLLLDELPLPVQLLGGLLILAGVVVREARRAGHRDRGRAARWLARVLSSDPDLADQHQDRRGGRDRQQGADRRRTARRRSGRRSR